MSEETIYKLDIAREEALQEAYNQINNHYSTMINPVEQNTDVTAIVAFDKYFQRRAGNIPLKGRIYIGPPHGADYMSLNIPEVELIKVKRGTLSLEDVHEQTREICLAAVRQNGEDLQYVVEQTDEICLAAVEQAGMALEHVRRQTTEICLAAVKEDGYALQFVAEQTDELCLAAVRENGYALQFVNDKTLEICVAAVAQNRRVFEFVPVQYRTAVRRR